LNNKAIITTRKKKEQEQESQVGDALIRGDNVITIAVL
jgi:small nuclear ribonucleoprotein (snRNP)-like protein